MAASSRHTTQFLGGVDLTDTGLSVSDSTQKYASKFLSDAGLSVSDSLGEAFPIVLTDTGLVVSDSVASLRLRSLTETGATITDAVASSRTRLLSVTGLAVTDALAPGHAGALTDTGLAVSDSLASLRLRAIADTGVALTTTLVSLRQRNPTDTGVTVTDSIAESSGGISLTDVGLTVSDSVARSFPRSITETGLAVSDALAKVVATFIEDDGLDLSDSLGNIEISDEAFDGLDWVTGDSIDATLLVFATDTGCTITDSLAANPTRRRLLVDTGLAGGDFIAGKLVTKFTATTGLTVTDTLGRAHAAALTDTGLSVTDTTKKVARKFVADQGMTFNSSLVVSKNGHGASVNLADTGLTLVSSLASARALNRTVGPDRAVSMTDGVLVTVNGGPVNSCYRDFRRFLLDLDASTEYATWCSAEPGDCSTWTTYAAAILSGGAPPSPPSMSTAFGGALVDAGVIALDGIVPCRAKPPPSTAPHAAFTFAVSGLTVDFTNVSTPGLSGMFDSWLWTFGDGDTDPAVWDPSHTYAGGGIYVVTLTVVGADSDGISSVRHLVRVFVPATGGIHIDAAIF